MGRSSHGKDENHLPQTPPGVHGGISCRHDRHASGPGTGLTAHSRGWVSSMDFILGRSACTLTGAPPNAGSSLAKPQRELALWHRINGTAARKSPSGPPTTG